MVEIQGTESAPEVSRKPADPVVEFFNRRAKDYDREYTGETPGGFALRVRREKVMAMFDKPGGRVLDVGCGPGVMVEPVLSRGCSFWGVDPSTEMIGIGRSRFPEGPRVSFHCAGAQRLPFADGYFDAVLCMGVIDALEDRLAAMREMLRVLKPNGTLIITFANVRNPYAWWKAYLFYPLVGVWHGFLARLRGSKVAGRRAAGKTRTLYSVKSAHEALVSQGAAILQTVGYYYNPFLSPLDEMMPSLALAATKKLEDRSQGKPNWLAAGFIVKAQKLSGS
jgi:ubiquinone/menaquinone biosynthesis C-methylase UbiE